MRTFPEFKQQIFQAVLSILHLLFNLSGQLRNGKGWVMTMDLPTWYTSTTESLPIPIRFRNSTGMVKPED